MYVLSRYFQPEKIISIDINHSDKQTLFFRTFTPQDSNFICASSYSPKTIGEVDSILGVETIDLLFIDGDHRYQGVKQDFENYPTIVRSGGWICLDDILQTHRPGIEVYRFWEELEKSDRETREILEHNERDSGGIGVVRPD